ncbi:FeoA family protein [Hydrogenimonas sp.]
MKLSELPIGQKAKIKKITTSDEGIKNRLHSLGLAKGETVQMLKFTLAKGTYEISAADSRVALRKEEAESIEVEEI